MKNAEKLSKYMMIAKERFIGIEKNNRSVDKQINLQEAKVLQLLGDGENTKMSEVAKRLKLSLSRVTALIDKLEDMEYVQRIRSDTDRRVIYIQITNTGKEIYDVLYEKSLQKMYVMLEALDEEEQNTLIELFQKIFRKLEEE